jgi:hypothetical protein
MNRIFASELVETEGIVKKKKKIAFSAVVPYRLVEVGRRFRGAYYLHHRPDYGRSAHL